MAFAFFFNIFLLAFFCPMKRRSEKKITLATSTHFVMFGRLFAICIRMALSFCTVRAINCGQIAERQTVSFHHEYLAVGCRQKVRATIFTQMRTIGRCICTNDECFAFLFIHWPFFVAVVVAKHFSTTTKQIDKLRDTKQLKIKPQHRLWPCQNTTFLSIIYHLWLIVFCMVNDNKTCTLVQCNRRWENERIHKRMCLVFGMLVVIGWNTCDGNRVIYVDDCNAQICWCANVFLKLILTHPLIPFKSQLFYSEYPIPNIHRHFFLLHHLLWVLLLP